MLKKLIWWVVAGILLVVLFSQIDIYELQSILRQTEWKVILYLLVLQTITQLLVNLQWYSIAKFAKIDISFWGMFYINSQGTVMESITPGMKFGGELARGVLITRMGKCSGHQAAVIVALQKIFSLGAFVLVSIMSVVFLSLRSAFFQSIIVRLSIYLVLGLFLLAFIVIFFAPKRILNWITSKQTPENSKLKAIKRFFENVLDHLLLFESNRRELFAQFLLAFIIWLFYPVKLYLLAAQMQTYVPIFYITCITFVAYMVAMLPLFPGGLGGFESTMTGLLVGLGVSLSNAAALSVTFRFVTFWYVIVLSLVYTLVYRLINKQMSKERMLPDDE